MKKRFLSLKKILFWLITVIMIMPSFLSVFSGFAVMASESSGSDAVQSTEIIEGQSVEEPIVEPVMSAEISAAPAEETIVLPTTEDPVTPAAAEEAIVVESSISGEVTSLETATAPASEETSAPASAFSLETVSVVPAASLESVAPMAASNTAYYYADPDYISIGGYINTTSTNDHTLVGPVWVQDGNVYIAMKTTHEMDETEQMTINGTMPLSYQQWDLGQSVYIDDAEMKPDGLNGNISGNRWIVFQFLMGAINLGAGQVNTAYFHGRGNGFDVSGPIVFDVPKISVTINKTWIGPAAPVSFNLYRTDSLGDHLVPGSPFSLTPATPTPAVPAVLTIPNLPKTNNVGQIYDYYIEEINAYGYDVSISGDLNAADSYTFDVLNTYKRISVDVTKNWSGGPAEHPTVYIQLYQNDVAYGALIELENGETSYTWMGLPFEDEQGTDYRYTVAELAETDTEGAYGLGAPGNYSYAVTGDAIAGFLITNTYTSPSKAIYATKTWENGPADKPEVQFQLYRKVGATGLEEKVGGLVTAPDVNRTGTYDVSVLMGNYPERDSNGDPYLYLVRENGTPTNYTKTEDGLAITNTYVKPQIQLMGEKTWAEDTEGHRPAEISITLKRMIDGGMLEDVAVEVTTAANGWLYDFGMMDKTDSDGNEYSYSVVEGAVTDYDTAYPAGYLENGGWHLDITNTLVKGSLFIKKVDQNGEPLTSDNATFKITRTLPAAAAPFTQTLETDASGLLEFPDLMAGTYVLEETKAPDGYNLLKRDITIIIEKDAAGKAVIRTESGEIITAEDPLELENTPIRELPGTGGVGATLFMLVGMGIMVGAVFFYHKSDGKNGKH